MEKWLADAIFNAESIFGKPMVRICGNYVVLDNESAILVGTSDNVGRHIAMFVSGYLNEEFGEEGYAVEKMIDDNIVDDVMLTEMQILLRKPIDDMELSVRTSNALEKAGFKTIGDVVCKKKSEMIRCNHLGRKSIEELIEVLDTEYGLCLGDWRIGIAGRYEKKGL